VRTETESWKESGPHKKSAKELRSGKYQKEMGLNPVAPETGEL